MGRSGCRRLIGQGLPTPLSPALPNGRPSAGAKPGAASLAWHHLGGQEVGQGMPRELPSPEVTVPRPALPSERV